MYRYVYMYMYMNIYSHIHAHVHPSPITSLTFSLHLLNKQTNKQTHIFLLSSTYTCLSSSQNAMTKGRGQSKASHVPHKGRKGKFHILQLPQHAWH